ncbi:MAG TPA: precorrin-6y C5,15-methyltransferase (decarboxylating) subunit CbiE [Acidimicrobiia bacterium]
MPDGARITGAGGVPRITVIGFADPLPVAAAKALADADLVVGSPRLLEALGGTPFPGAASAARRTLALGTGAATLAEALDVLAGVVGRAVVLASGDPGFFGVVRALAERFGPDALEVHPAPSSVSLAFARLGLPWDDALVASTLGRPLEEAAALAAGAAKAAVLCCAGAPPEALGRALLDAGAAFDRVAVCSGLGTAAEAVEAMTLPALAAGRFPPASVVVLVRGSGVAASPVLAWGRPSRAYLHRGGMITKSEVRAVVLARLELPAAGVLWDVGAGSGSVGIEAAGLVPGLRVVAVERDAAACARIRANAAAAGVAVHVVEGEAPAVFEGLPDPQRVFVGGGGLAVLDAALDRLVPGGRVVATYAALDRAGEAWRRLGEMIQVSVSRAAPLAGGVRLVASDPVFVCWGPRP